MELQAWNTLLCTMKPFAIRFFMILSLLVSLQTSVSMAVAMEIMQNAKAAVSAHAVPAHVVSAHVVSAHCADMPGMAASDQVQDHTASSSEHHCKQCSINCCSGFLSITTSDAIPVIKPVQAYQETPVLPASRFVRINYRPPIFS